MNQEKLVQESGRSMVEILGVLAIIGVLTIGGILGYRVAVSKNEANTIADALNKFAVLYTAQSGKDCLALVDELNLPERYGCSAAEDATQFGLIVDNVSRDICVQLVQMNLNCQIYKDEGAVEVQGSNDCPEQASQLDFVFTTGAAASGEPEVSCNPACEHGSCVNGSCVCDGYWKGSACGTCPKMIGATCCWAWANGVNEAGECCSWETCCPAGSTDYCERRGTCCSAGQKLVGDNWDCTCCPIGSAGYSERQGRCCTTGEISLTFVPGADWGYSWWVCCSPGSTGYGTQTGRCCTASENPVWGRIYSSETMCCGPSDTYWNDTGCH